ncbi:MAG: C39 family peptidase, partial [Chthonomonadales bacterium]
LKWTIEAKAITPDHESNYYTMAKWSAGKSIGPRESLKGQKDADGLVDTDTLVLTHPASSVKVRVTASGVAQGSIPELKFIGLSMANTTVHPTALEPNKSAWGKQLAVPEKCQLSYKGGNVWCSPTGTSMMLNHWAKVCERPDLAIDVSDVAAGVLDPVYGGTGNWPFNAGYAGSFNGMRAYITRFSDVSELEDWVAKGIPVVCSVSYRLLKGLEKAEASGHIVVCVGFTPEGDPIMNDPWAHLEKGEKVRKTFKRKDLIAGWGHSHNTVYLVYPEGTALPKDRFGHWDHTGK